MNARPVGITGWALRAVIFLALAGLITVFQVDRHSRDRVGLMAYVPPGLGGFADAALARPLAMVEPEMAVERAEATLRHRPIDAGNLAAYALATVEAGDEAAAGQALTLAAQRGWRDTYTQVMVIGSALTGERWEVAAQRVDALARLRREEEAISGALSLIMQQEAAQRELAKRMIISFPLLDSVAKFVNKYPVFGPEVAQTLVFAEQEGEIECAQLARVARTLLANDLSEATRDIWPERCIESDDSAFGFSLVKGREDPFAWVFPPQAGISLRLGSSEDTLVVRNRDPLRRRFAYRYTLLEPGEYTITLEREDTTGKLSASTTRAANVSLTIRCVSAGEEARRPLFSDEYEGPIVLTVPEDCGTQYLSLTLDQGRVTDLSISID